MGARYRYTRSRFHEQVPELPGVPFGRGRFPPGHFAASAEMRRESDLHELNIFALYNHPCGFFATAEANWYKQDNDTLKGLDRGLAHFANHGPPGDDFWQFNVIAGWRFYRNQCEISCGCIFNINDTDYKLDPLNPYVELPRSGSLMVRAERIWF